MEQTAQNAAETSFLTPEQQDGLNFFNENFESLYGNPLHKHKFVVVHNRKIEGVFDTFENAIRFAVANFALGEFIVQQLIKDDEVIGFLSPDLVA